MPRVGKRFVDLMNSVRVLKSMLKGQIKGVEVVQNFAECPKGDNSVRPFVYVEYSERYFKEVNIKSPNHPDKIIKRAAKESGLTKSFKYAGDEIVSGKRDIGYELRNNVSLNS